MALLLLANLLCHLTTMMQHTARADKRSDCGVVVCRGMCANGQEQVCTSLDGMLLHIVLTVGEPLSLCLCPLQKATIPAIAATKL